MELPLSLYGREASKITTQETIVSLKVIQQWNGVSASPQLEAENPKIYNKISEEIVENEQDETKWHGNYANMLQHNEIMHCMQKSSIPVKI